MKIVFLIEKYGNHCNRLFQSLHFNALCINENSVFFNISLLGILKYDNYFFKIFDILNNLVLTFISRRLKRFYKKGKISFRFLKSNEIILVKGWDFRSEKFTEKYHKELKEIYSFKKSFSKEFDNLVNNLTSLKSEGKYLVGIHLRRGDYKQWKEGKYFFSDATYNKVINQLRDILKEEKKDPFLIAVSDQNISNCINYDLKYDNGRWIDDQFLLQQCDLIVGPPSTFTMWASYISQTPLIKIKSNGQIDFKNKSICIG